MSWWTFMCEYLTLNLDTEMDVFKHYNFCSKSLGKPKTLEYEITMSSICRCLYSISTNWFYISYNHSFPQTLLTYFAYMGVKSAAVLIYRNQRSNVPILVYNLTKNTAQSDHCTLMMFWVSLQSLSWGILSNTALHSKMLLDWKENKIKIFSLLQNKHIRRTTLNYFKAT